jgi:DNA-binding beta-propeller fold protein YncE
MRNPACQNLPLPKSPLLLIVFILLLVGLLIGCSLTPVEQTPIVDPGATLHLFLQPMPQEAHQLSLTVASINARTVGGRDIPLLGPWSFEPTTRIGQQTKLLQQKLPPGEYAGLSLELSAAKLQTEAEPIDLLIETKNQLIPINFLITAHQNQALFLSLSPDRLITGGYKLTAKFSARKAQSPLPELKGVISHPQSGMLTIFEKKTPTIIDVVAIGQGPAGMALDQRNRLIYLALTEENSIVAFDLVRNRIQRKVRLHAGARPTELALSTDGDTLVSLNSGTNSISIISTTSLSERQRILLSTTPASVCTSATNLAYIALPDINALALIDLQRDNVIATANLTDTAVKGVADRSGRQIYLLTENSPDLLVFDTAGMTVINRVSIGYGARCLTLNKNNGLIYVGMRSGKIVVIDPQIGLPIDSFKAEPDIIAIAADRKENSLFVVSRENNLLTKYDLVSQRKLATLELGAAGSDVIVMGEQ